MKFRARNYVEEDATFSLPREPAQEHPLGSTCVARPACPPNPETTALQCFGDVLVDPLRRTCLQDFPLATQVEAAVQERPSPHLELKGTLDEWAEAASKEWEGHRKSILQKFSSNGVIKVPMTLNIPSKQSKDVRKFSAAPLHQSDELRKGFKDDEEIISQEEYVFRLQELNKNIAHAWNNNERVAMLRLAVKVTKVLSDTSVPRFYPTVYILATDILETIGKWVWERIKGKAELDENGKLRKSLPRNFTADDVLQEAKDTCRNWFQKISSIQELLPRVYLEIAILHCMRFLQTGSPISEFQRLNMMLRGLTDPMVAAYARLYLARKGRSIFPQETGYLIMGLDDYLVLYRRFLSGGLERSIAKSGIDRQVYASLVEPVFELYLLYICAFAENEELAFIVRTFCEKPSGSEEKQFVPVSVLLHHLLKQLPAAVVSMRVMDFCRILKGCTDISKPQYLNYRMLGMKLCESHPPAELRLGLLNNVWKVVGKFEDQMEYLNVVDVFVDYVLQCCSENELCVLLRDIVKHFSNDTPLENALKILESIVIKVMENSANIRSVLNMKNFMELLNKFHGEAKISVYKKLLSFICRHNQAVEDPVERHFAFELSKDIYKSLDSLSGEDEQRQIDHLITRFVQLVDFKEDPEQHVLFLVECRGVFVTLEVVRETLVHVSNRLAVSALRKRKADQHAIDFAKTCITFSEVTIPSLENVQKRILLYIGSAEVALLCGLVSHSESLLYSSLACIQEPDRLDDIKKGNTEIEPLSCIQKLCSLLIVFPGHPKLGAFYLLRALLDTINNNLGFKDSLKLQMLLGVVLACHSLSQNSLPYHIDSLEMLSNDALFRGKVSYMEELTQLAQEVVERIITINESTLGNETVIMKQVFDKAFESDGHYKMDKNDSAIAQTARPT